MTAILLAIALQEPPRESPSQLLTRMMARYHDAKTLGGTITTRVTWENNRLEVDTTLWFERPGKLYLKQATNLGPRYLVTADGQEFSYDKPLSGRLEDLEKGGRLLEAQGGRTLQEVYAIASLSIAERSTPLDLAIARLPDLRMLRDQWATVEDGGTADLEGEACRRIVGDWTSNPEYGVLGRYEMLVGPEADLRRFRVVGPNPEGKGAVDRLHEVRLKVGAVPPEGQFKVVR